MNSQLKKALSELTGAYYEEAPKEARYPYTVFSVRRISEEDGVETYSLEIDAWDNSPFYSGAEDMMDTLELKLHRCSFSTEGLLIRTYKGNRQNIPDPDKSLKRVREQFEMKVYRKEG